MHHKGWELWLLKHRPQDCEGRKEFNFSYFFPLLKVPPSLQPPAEGTHLRAQAAPHCPKVELALALAPAVEAALQGKNEGPLCGTRLPALLGE